jgi:hypothetical protein
VKAIRRRGAATAGKRNADRAELPVEDSNFFRPRSADYDSRALLARDWGINK